MKGIHTCFTAALLIGLCASSATASELPQSYQGKWAPDCHSPEAEMLGIEVDGNMAFYGIEECSAEKVSARGQGIDIEFECAVLMDASARKTHWELTGKDRLVETDIAHPEQTRTYLRCATAKQ